LEDRSFDFSLIDALIIILTVRAKEVQYNKMKVNRVFTLTKVDIIIHLRLKIDDSAITSIIVLVFIWESLLTTTVKNINATIMDFIINNSK